MVYLNQYQLLPLDRTRELFFDVFGQSISVGTISSALKTAYDCLSSAEAHIKDQLAQGQLLHSDETGFKVNKACYWLHVGSSKRLTYYAAHKKRGKVAIEEIGLLNRFEGRLVHDHFTAYFQYGKPHSLCNAHHLRELTYIQERYDYYWAKALESLLITIKKAVESHYAKTGCA